MNSKRFYVYVLCDPRKKGTYQYGSSLFLYEPFYVGKGKNHRCEEHFYYRNSEDDHKSHKIRKIYEETNLEPIIIKLYENLFEEVAFEVEKFLISQIGRFDLGKGPLTNLTAGGEGAAGFIFSEESRKKMREYRIGKTHTQHTKQKMSQSRKGKQPMLGKRHTQEARQKISETHKGKKLTKEHKIKIGETIKGRIQSKKTIEKRVQSKRKNNQIRKTISQYIMTLILFHPEFQPIKRVF